MLPSSRAKHRAMAKTQAANQATVVFGQGWELNSPAASALTAELVGTSSAIAWVSSYPEIALLAGRAKLSPTRSRLQALDEAGECDERPDATESPGVGRSCDRAHAMVMHPQRAANVRN